jgi:hypothetical protein
MCDLDAHLISLVNIDRNSLIAILSSESRRTVGKLCSTAHLLRSAQNDARPWSVPLTGMLSAIDRNTCPPSNGMPVLHHRNTHLSSRLDYTTM